MEAILGILMLVLVLVGALCALFLAFAQPIWGIVDVATSRDHSSGIKATVIILTLILLGPLMTIGYACFGTRSKTLRMTTLVTLAALLVVAASVMGLAMAVPAVTSHWGGGASSTTATTGALSAGDASPGAPHGVPATEVVPFIALHLVQTSKSDWSISIAQFSGHGPDAASALPLVLPSIYPISHLAVDTNGPAYYAMTTHKVGRIIPATGRFSEFETDPAIGKPSWPSAIAFDSKQGILLIAARSTGYSYNPVTGEWKALPGLKDNNLVALEYVADKGVLYGLRSQPGGGLITTLVKMTPNGATLQEADLSMPISVARYPHPMAQLCRSGDRLIVLVSPTERGVSAATASGQSILFSVDPESGICLPIETQLASQSLEGE